jgi:hypothetical protein
VKIKEAKYDRVKRVSEREAQLGVGRGCQLKRI